VHDRRQASTRLSAAEALEHPWFRAQLGYTPRPTSELPSIPHLGSVDSLVMEEREEVVMPV
jgi:hypothetical protein